MKLADQLCSIEQGRKLKELGIIQGKSLFCYCCVMPDPTGEKYYFDIFHRDDPDQTLIEAIFDLFTISELLLMSPYGIRLEKSLNTKRYYCYDLKQDGMVSHETAAIACTDKLIELIEAKRLNIEEINGYLI